VSTAVGAEGLPLTPGEHYLAADEPAEFARAVVRLLHDPGERGRLGRAGRALVEAQYSWQAAAARFEEELEAGLELGGLTQQKQEPGRRRWSVAAGGSGEA
jgi:glycosyltransferase involved in cell wall biosynthesis